MIKLRRSELLSALALVARTGAENLHLHSGAITAATGSLSCSVVIDGLSSMSPLTIPLAHFRAILKAMVSDEIELQGFHDGVKIFGQNEQFSVRALSVPDLSPPSRCGEFLDVDAAELRVAIEQCLPAVESDGGAFALQGVYFVADGKRLKLTACDGRRLHTVDLCATSIKWSGPIDPRAARLFARICKSGNAVLCFSDNAIHLRCGSADVSSAVLCGRLPVSLDDRVLAANAVEMDVVAGDLASAANRAALISDRSEWSLSGGCLAVEAGSSLGRAAVEILVPSADSISLQISSSRVADALSAVASSETVRLSISDENMRVRAGNFFAVVQGFANE